MLRTALTAPRLRRRRDSNSLPDDPYKTLGLDRASRMTYDARVYKSGQPKLTPTTAATPRSSSGSRRPTRRWAMRRSANGTTGRFDFGSQSQGFPAGGASDSETRSGSSRRSFGAGRRGGPQQRRRRPRVVPREVRLKLSLADLFEGGSFSVKCRAPSRVQVARAAVARFRPVRVARAAA